MKEMRNKLRLGRIAFTNVWPVFHHFPDQFKEEVEIVSQVPTSLNQALAEGSIDLSPISSFAYAEHYDQYELMPDLSVSCYGKVNSILLFHRKPLSELRYGRIALPTTSATSTNLLKVIMHKFYEGEPSYDYAEPNLEAMMSEADAALLIGDDAIRASWTNRSYDVTDLGEEWTRMTGHWMSFAVWAIRKDAAARFPGTIQAVYQAFQMSKRSGLRNPRPIVEKAVAEIGGTHAFWTQYFSGLSHDFSESQQAGLHLYYQYVKELGLLDHTVPIQIWTNNTVA